MRLHVYRSGREFLDALESGTGCLYATFARKDTDPPILRRSEVVSAARGHRNISEVPELRADAQRRLRQFFELAARDDGPGRYAHSSRVPLAIPEYADIGLLFLLAALKAQEPDAVVHALIADPRRAELARFLAGGGRPPAFRASSRRGVVRALRSFTRRAVSRPPHETCDVLVFTLGDSVPAGRADTYFGDFAAALGRRGSVHTVFAAGGARLRFPRRARTSPLEAFLGPLDVARAWAAQRRSDSPGDAHAAFDDVLLGYLRAQEHASGEVLMLDLMARMFERMLVTLKPRALVYPFENRSWEKSLLRAARRQGVSRCVGYQHSAITPRHLAFSGGAELCGVDQLPDTILTCGEVTADLIGSAMPQARPLLEVGAALRAARMKVEAPAGWGVLAPISSSRAEAYELLRVLHELVEHCDVPVVVRPHPTIPMDDLFAQFSWPPRVRLSRGGALADDFHDCAVIAYSSSTVALEGMLYGRLPLFVEVGDLPSGDPLHGEHDFRFRAATGRALAETIARIRGYDSGELARLRASACLYAERYLIEPTPERVERMVDVVVRC